MVAQAPDRLGEQVRTAVRLALARNTHLQADEVYKPPSIGLFKDADARKLDFLPAPDLATIADELITTCDELSHLAEVEVSYLWKREGGERNGHATLGACSKASGLIRHFSGAAWVIWLAADWAVVYSLTRQQIEAALYHELLHAGINEDNAPSLVGHDVEMFSREVTRYGLWREPLKLAARAFEQLPMFGEQRA